MFFLILWYDIQAWHLVHLYNDYLCMDSFKSHPVRLNYRPLKDSLESTDNWGDSANHRAVTSHKLMKMSDSLRGDESDRQMCCVRPDWRLWQVWGRTGGRVEDSL